MLAQETRHVRRFVVRLEPGEDLAASLSRFAQADGYRAGWVKGRGLLEWAELASFDGEDRAFRSAKRIEGPLTVAFEGALAMRLGEPTFELDGMVSREVDGVPHALGGRITQASALSVECVIEVFEDVRLERQEDATLGLPVWRSGERIPGVAARARAVVAEPSKPGTPKPAITPSTPVRAAEPAPTTGLAKPEPTADKPAPLVSWAAVAAVSKNAPEPEANESSDPQRGDFVEHRQFGLCRVEGDDPDGGTRIRLPSGARKTLRLDVMEVLPPRREAGRVVYPIRPRSR
jgi:predicted DNA-binding protein with PD1-like motif